MADEQLVQAIDDDAAHIGLLAAIAHGDREAFVRFYRSTHDRVFGLALRIVRTRAAAERVTEEVYLQVWEIAGQYDRRANSPIGWLVALTHRRAVDRVRGESRSCAGAVPPQHRLSGIDAWPAAAAPRSRRRMPNVDALTAAQRETLSLTYYGGRTYSEVAEQLGLSSADIALRLRDCIERLRPLPTIS
ncbi:sigma-70 family RNA polymerase sigma factor [Nocardia acidivorans]|uniref:sigma-70 family RNA polymerase sigma factor n=1 Tax=Nocardia acidivorans TaxID=404580 RepID=UPI000A776702|nr:sigma-70 family RNA polymerase sigma factor [Nocardia acidivorans]